jgi:hypothetical protein
MADGIQLTLMIGPGLPLAVPRSVLDTLESVQVTSGKDGTGFQLSFTAGTASGLIKTMLPAGYLDPIVTRVIIAVTFNGLPNVLMDGIITHQQFAPANEPGKSTITVTGEDLSVLMDLVELPKPMPSIPDNLKVMAALAPYLALGIVPVVIPPIVPVIKSPTTQIESQPLMTDRAFIQTLAQRNGYVFYVEPGPLPMQSIAYFGPDVRIPVPQPALNVNMDAHTNVESMSFSLDGTAKKVRVYTVMDPITKKIPVPIPLPNINAFKPPLGARPTLPAKVEFAKDVAKDGAAEGARGILAYLMNNSDAISVTGSLDVLRYGRVLRSRMLAGVRGAGLAYDGLYYVNSVTHNIKRGEYKQSFQLSRDGLISNTPRVVP